MSWYSMICCAYMHNRRWAPGLFTLNNVSVIDIRLRSSELVYQCSMVPDLLFVDVPELPLSFQHQFVLRQQQYFAQ